MNDDNSNTSCSSRLEDLFSLSVANLHTHSISKGFTLQQLIPVHTSLLESSGVVAIEKGIHPPRKENDGDQVMGDAVADKESDSELTWLKEFLDQSNNDFAMSDVYDTNLVLCRRILDSNNGSHDNDREKLLVWQYLLHKARPNNSHETSPLSSTSMQWLSIILFHYILRPDNQGRISDELRKVLLELSLEWVLSEFEYESKMNNSREKREKNWGDIRTQLKQVAEESITEHSDSMPQSSRIVTTIVFKYLAKEQSDEDDSFLPFLISMYYEHLWLNLEFCCSGNTTKDPAKTKLLSELSKTMLLPMLKEFQQTTDDQQETSSRITERAAHALCFELDSLFRGKLFPLLETNGILGDVNEDDDEKVETLQHFLLVATTVLCPLLPWYLKQQKQHEQQLQPLLWKFIYVCLQQGRRSIIKGRECDNHSGRGRGDQGGNLAFASGAGGVASMLRRRALYLLDILVAQSPSSMWKDYILCVETFEMENERHIIDQIWPVVAKLVEEANKNTGGDCRSNNDQQHSIPLITTKWIELLVGRILSAEQLAVRKLGVFRLLQVLGRPVTQSSLLQSETKAKAAAIVTPEPVAMDTLSTPDFENNYSKKKKKRDSSKQAQQKQKKKTKKSGGSSKGATLEVLSTEMLLTSLCPQTFLWDVLVPSWDSLGGTSVGYTIHLDNPKGTNHTSGSPVAKFAKIDMVPLFCQTIQNYAIIASTCGSESASSSSLPIQFSSLFWKGLWNWERIVCHLSAKTLLSVYRPISELLAVTEPNETPGFSKDTMIQIIPVDDEDLHAIRYTFAQLFRDNHMVLSHRKQFLKMLSRMISLAKLPPSRIPADSKTKNWSPIHVLSLLALFSSSYFPALDSEDVTDWSIENEEMLVMAGKFVRQFESQASSKDHAVTVGAALASAFVTSQIHLPSVDSSETDKKLASLSPGWNPVDGTSPDDRELGWAVSLFCTLAVSEKIRHTSGELLWPAIHKGLSQSASVILSKGNHPKADFVARALLLLENGCKLRQLSGLGNGDLVVNPKSQQIMPPPPNIEQMLQNSIDFIQWHIRMLLATESHKEDDPEEGRKSKRFTGSYAFLISQLKVLHQSYPSSQVVSSVMNDLLEKSTKDLEELLAGKDATSGEGDVKKLLLVALIYGACSCGAEPETKSYASLIRLLINTGLSTSGEGQPGVWVKSSRSIIQFARWAAISFLLPKLLEDTSDNASDQTQDEIDQLIDDLFKEGIKSASITPSDAIKPLFDCIVLSSRQWIGASSKYDPTQVETLCVDNLTQIVNTLLSLIKQSTRSRESACMLNDFCALVFQTKLLREEYDRTVKDPAPKCRTPIRDGFRKLIKMAGRYRPQITRAILCRITIGWLDEEGSDCRGISAIPYREDIVKLLLFKEGKYDESSSNQSMEELPSTGVTEIPSNTNYHSMTRTFILVFFGQLPEPNAGLNPIVNKELLQFIILDLLQQATPEKGTHPSLVMRGTPTYCIKMRAWQALCILNRFVTEEIASDVCTIAFAAMNELLHSQIRYFLEIFTIKCATMHSSIFGEAFLKDICRTDLSLQHVSSLMIMGGNFILGKYQLDYFVQNDEDKSRSKRVLAAVVPWLSSTQGFSRAIAQLIVYQLIPRVISVENKNSVNTSELDNDWFLKSTYNFLDQNREMKRLRNKQTKFFERYDCESMSTPEGIYSIKVDEAQEADPVHLIDSMKEALRSTYDEAHEADAPSWKHVEEMMVDASMDLDNASDTNEDASSTVQRKIIPLDSLNLALEDLREQRLSNARGAHKQNLIVCASLVDKVPNLAGLARTCEIFATQSLVLPDLSVSKMDNFQSISVGAADWIDMEEVKEEALLSWLLQKKAEGFWIVGLEQTSSSVPLHTIEIPEIAASKNNNKTVLLLGKEKEGIPVQFLQAVDDCVEIPQFGMIRSLNVHVSGAITIWELTRKTRLAMLEEQKSKQQQN